MMLRIQGALTALLLWSTASLASSKGLKQRTAPSLGESAAKDPKLVRSLLSKASVRRRVEEDDQYNGFGFDVTQYSIKYTGCAAIKTYSDELAEQEDLDTVLQTKRFVVFRLCPTEYCNKYTATGCTADYGEYILDMDIYLEVVQQYNEEVLQQYCEGCNQCYENAYNDDDANNNNRGRRRLEEAADDADDVDEAADDAADDVEEAGDDAVSYCDSMCPDYRDVCDVEEDDDGGNNNNNGDDEEEEVMVEEFFECREAENENNNNNGNNRNQGYFLAPHCADDDYSIIIGVYSEETCSNYIGNDISVYDATGIDLSGIDMSVYYPKDCISCKEERNWWEDDENGDGDNNQDNGEEINRFCEELYEQSAGCNQYFDTLNDNSNYYSANQQAGQERVCTFIENVMGGKYDESGEIILNHWYFNFSDWRNNEEYAKAFNKARKLVSPGQIAGLVITLVACFIMAVWACCLHGALARKGLQWRPRRGKHTDPTAISRQNSGIVMRRSRSGPNTNPLV